MKTIKKLTFVLALVSLIVSLPACVLPPAYSNSGRSYVAASPAANETRTAYVRPVVTVETIRPNVVVPRRTVIVSPQPAPVIWSRPFACARPYNRTRTVAVRRPVNSPPKIRPFRKISTRPRSKPVRKPCDYFADHTRSRDDRARINVRVDNHITIQNNNNRRNNSRNIYPSGKSRNDRMKGVSAAIRGNREKSRPKKSAPGWSKERRASQNNGLHKGYSKQKNTGKQPVRAVKFRGNQARSKGKNQVDLAKTPRVFHRVVKAVSKAPARDKAAPSRGFKQPKNRGDYPGFDPGNRPKTGKPDQGRNGKSSKPDRQNKKHDKASSNGKSRKFREADRGKGTGKRR